MPSARVGAGAHGAFAPSRGIPGRGASPLSAQGVARWIQRDPYFGYLLVLPLIIWTLLTIVYPVFDAVRLSLMGVGYVGSAGKFVGLGNYIAVLAGREFWHTAWVTVLWTALNVTLQVVAALLAALVLNQEFWGREFARNWIILPWLFPSIVLAAMAKWMLDPTLGVVNHVLLSAGLIRSPVSFLGSPHLAFLTVAVVNAWHWFPFFSVIILAALQTIPREASESAEIDGAGYLARLWCVELPFIRQVITVVIFIASLWAANIFDVIWLLTHGGPLYATNTFPILIYYKGFQEYRISLAAAVSMPMFLALLAYGLWYMRRFMRGDVEGAAS